MSQVLKNLNLLRKDLETFLRPEILSKLVTFLDTVGSDESMLARYVWFSENSENGEQCRYAAMAKHFFLENKARDVATQIKWLYENWARFETETSEE